MSFSVKNFLSFKDLTTFSLIAGKGSRFSNHIISNDSNLRILKGAVCFGPNASGKSNLIKAISTSKNLVLNSLKNYSLDNMFFKMDRQRYDYLSFFEFVFFIENEIITYNYTLDLSKKIIHEETFSYGKSKKNVFTRKLDGNKYIINTNFKFKNKSDAAKFSFYCEPFMSAENFSKFSKIFLLTEIAERSSSDTESFAMFKNLLLAFKKIATIYPSTKLNLIPSIIDQPNSIRELTKFLRDYGSDISDITKKEIEYSKIFEQILPSERDEFEREISSALEETDEIVIKGRRSMYRIKRNDDGIKAHKLTIEHGNMSYDFDYEDESDGTQRLFDFSPLFIGDNRDCLFLIDEIDQSLHTKIVRKLIIGLFNDPKNANTQYIITSHDLNLIDLNLLRQDEIYFIDKTDSSVIIPLSKYNVRFDKDILKDYLNGMFGAIPKIK